MANILKHWRRRYKSSFHEVFLCCCDRMGADTHFTRQADKIVNQANDWDYWRALRWDEPAEGHQAAAAEDTRPVGNVANMEADALQEMWASGAEHIAEASGAHHYADAPAGAGDAGVGPVLVASSGFAAVQPLAVRYDDGDARWQPLHSQRYSDVALQIGRKRKTRRGSKRRRASCETTLRASERTYKNWDAEVDDRVADMRKLATERLQDRSRRFAEKVRRMQYDLGHTPNSTYVAGKLAAAFGEVVLAPDTSRRRSNVVGPALTTRQKNAEDAKTKLRWETRQWLAGNEVSRKPLEDPHKMHRRATTVAFTGVDDETRPKCVLSENMAEEACEGPTVASPSKSRPGAGAEGVVRKTCFIRQNIKEALAFEHNQVHTARRTTAAAVFEASEARIMNLQEELHELAACLGPRLAEQRIALQDAPPTTPGGSTRS